MTPLQIRIGGAVVAAGGLTWATTSVLAPPVDGQITVPDLWGSAAFQAGVIALVAVLRATRATGDGRWGRGVLVAEGVALLGAVVVTALSILSGGVPFTGALLVLDLFWPLSMVGLIAVAVTVVAARRWPPAPRLLTLAVSLWLLVATATALLPVAAQDVVVPAYLALTCGLLGVAILRDVAPADSRAAAVA